MILHPYPAFVTCLALFVYVWTVMACGSARGRYGVKAPAVTGHPEFERRFRIQQNTMEQLVLFLPSLWIFSQAVSPLWGGLIGLAFVAGRVLYVVTYTRNPDSRGPGFAIGGISSLVLLVGGFLGVLRLLAIEASFL